MGANPGNFVCSVVGKKGYWVIGLLGYFVIRLLRKSGRIGHSLNLPEGAWVLAPSAVKAGGQMWTDSKQMQDYPVYTE